MARLTFSGRIGGGRSAMPAGSAGSITLPAGAPVPRGFNPVATGAEWTPAGSTRTYARSLRGT